MKPTYFQMMRAGGFVTAAATIGLGILLLPACSVSERSRALDEPQNTAKTIALQVCSNCHGVHGNSISPNFPKLAGQREVYLAEQLKLFKSHGRSDPAGFEYMWGLSARLSDKQIDELAQYYAGQTMSPGKKGNANLIKKGELVYQTGDPDKNIPACATCHGTKAEGLETFPRLSGQHADYMVKQLNVILKTEGRPAGTPMKALEHALTDDNIASVAAYLESL